MERPTSPVRHRRLALTIGLLLLLALLLPLLRGAHLQAEAAWTDGCLAQGGLVETVPGPTNPLIVGSDAPTLTCWSADGHVLARRH